MTRLLIVHHTPSPAMHALFEAARDGLGQPELRDVEVVARAALTCSAVDVLDADGYVIGTPANLGYMAGAVKHFFDTIYYPCLEATQRRPFGCYVHGNDDTAGAVRAIDKITTGLGWRKVTDHVEVVGAPGRDDLDRCWNLAATVAASLLD